MDLIISDIHADIDSLNSILKLCTSQKFIENYGEFDRVINLGDVLERGTHPKQVIQKFKELAKTHPIQSVIGNHDEAFLYNRLVSGSSPESLGAHSSLKENDLLFFEQNKDGSYGQQEFIDKKNNLIGVHGGPIDPEKIVPKNAGEESWLYQKSWQRISEGDSEFFSFYGYHYKPSSAFKEGKTQLKNFVIFCGHQHIETVLKQERGKISEIFSKIPTKSEDISSYHLLKKEIELDPFSNYIIRLGLGGPEGYYGTGKPNPHFGINLQSQNQVILFEIKSG